jgi:hypothetical protein
VPHLGRPESTATLLSQASNIARHFCNYKPFFFCVHWYFEIKICASKWLQQTIRDMKCSTDFGTNMTGVGFQVIIYITMFWDVTSSSDECFGRHILQFM